MNWEIWRIVTLPDDEGSPEIIEERPQATCYDEQMAWHWIDGHIQLFWHGNMPDNIYYEVRPA